jgi:hypothetical protein
LHSEDEYCMVSRVSNDRTPPFVNLYAIKYSYFSLQLNP